MKLVKIEWVDAECTNGWQTAGDEVELPLCTTIGYLVKETPDLLVVTSTTSIDDYLGSVSIPRVWVKSMREYELIDD